MIGTRISTDDQPPLEQMLARAIAQILAMPQKLEQIQQFQAEQCEQVPQFQEAQSLQGRSLQKLEGSVLKLTEAVEALYGKQDCLEQTSRQQTLLSEQHYQRHIIEPLVRRVFPLIDMLLEATSGSDGQPHPNDQLDLLEALKAELHELLAGYGVEPIRATAGSVFEAKTMAPARLVPTYRQENDKMVESMLRLGFRRGEQILRAAMVSIYRFEGSKQISSEPQQERLGEL